MFGAAALLVLRSLGERRGAPRRAAVRRAGRPGDRRADRGAGLLRGEPRAVAAVDRIVQERVLGERVVRVKLWTPTGASSTRTSRASSARASRSTRRSSTCCGPGPRATLSDLSGPENRFERGQGDLYEVYLPIRAPDGTPLLFETYQRRSAVAATGRRIWMPFAALLLGEPRLLWLVQVPLAWRLARRLRRSQAEREALLVRARRGVRRRAAADRGRSPRRARPGSRRDLVLAERRRRRPRVARDAARRSSAAAAGTRDAMRQLRSLLVEIHPPNLRASGLEAALADLLAPLQARGVGDRAHGRPGAELDEDAERLVYRPPRRRCGTSRHAGAHRVASPWSGTSDGVRLEVTDDGVGFAPDDRERRREEGHVGLSLLEELAARAGGRLEVRSAPGEGTTFALEVPHP